MLYVHLCLGCCAAEMFARQLLARVALRFAEELQRPPRRHDQPSGSTQAAGPQQRYNMTAPDSADATPFQALAPSPLLLLGELAKQSTSGGLYGHNMNNSQR